MITAADMDFGNVATGDDKKARSEMTIPDDMSQMVFMDENDLKDYRDDVDVNLYLVKLMPFLTIAYGPKSSGTGRSSAANVVKFLSGNTKKEIVNRVGIDCATKADIT